MTKAIQDTAADNIRTNERDFIKNLKARFSVLRPVEQIDYQLHTLPAHEKLFLTGMQLLGYPLVNVERDASEELKTLKLSKAARDTDVRILVLKARLKVADDIEMQQSVQRNREKMAKTNALLMSVPLFFGALLFYGAIAHFL